MPKLSSTGRHVALQLRSMASLATEGTDEQLYIFIVTYRLNISAPSDLVQYLPVMYFETGSGIPPDCPRFDSGYLVRDVLSGAAGWSAEEIDEFRAWLEHNDALDEWAAQEFVAVDHAIKTSRYWQSELARD